MKRFSIVVVNYNKINYLPKVAERIQKAALGAELILVDDCSNDGSFEWGFDSRIFSKVYRKPVREEYCLCTMRNIGIGMATRDYAVVLDADCLPDEVYFTNLLKAMDNNKDQKTIFVGFTDYYCDKGESFLLEDPRKAYLAKNDSCPIEYRDAFGGNICFPIQAWKDVGGFDESFNGFWGYEDLDFAYRCAKVGYQFLCTRGVQVRHLQHPTRAKIEQSDLKGRNFRLMFEKHPEIKSK